MTKEPLPTTHTQSAEPVARVGRSRRQGRLWRRPSINMTVRGFEKSFGEHTWRKQLGETLRGYTEIGEYLEEY